MNFSEKTAMIRAKCRPSQGRGPYILMALIISGSFLLPLTARAKGKRAGCSEPVARAGYEYTVAAVDLPSVDNLSRTRDGSIYATLERKGGRGEVVRLMPDGKSKIILTGLKRPDGIRADRGKLFIVEETKKGRVLEYDIKKKTLRVMKKIGHLEGLAVVSREELLLTEDRKKGTLLRLSPDGTVTVLLRGLIRPEGIVLGKNGEVFIAETATGKVLKFSGGKTETILRGLNNPDQLAISADGALLITEDANPGRFLSYKNSKLKTIADCLASPQGILPLPDGILVSEQRRNRVLKFTDGQQR